MYQEESGSRVSTAEASDRTEYLIAQAQRGDQHSFELLVARYYALVYSIAYAGLKRRESAEDLTQEVFLRCWLKIDSLKQPDRFPSWLSQMTRRLALDWLRKDQRRSALLNLVPIDGETFEVPDHQQKDARLQEAEREEREALHRAYAKLSPDLQEVLSMHYGANLSRQEIGRILKRHPTTVGRQLDRGVALIRRMLGPENQHCEGALNDLAPRKGALLHASSVIAATTTLKGEQLIRIQAALAHHPTTFLHLLTPTTVTLLQQGTLIMETKYALATGVALLGLVGGIAFYREQSTANTIVAQQGVEVSVERDPAASQEIPWDGFRTISISFGESVSAMSSPRTFGNVEGRMLFEFEAEGGAPLRVAEIWEWSGQWNWQLIPTNTVIPGQVPSDTQILIQGGQEGDVLFVRSLVAEATTTGINCHIYVSRSERGGRRWFELNGQYGNGTISLNEYRREVGKLIAGEGLLPPPDRRLERLRWEQYLAAYTP